MSEPATIPVQFGIQRLPLDMELHVCARATVGDRIYQAGRAYSLFDENRLGMVEIRKELEAEVRAKVEADQRSTGLEPEAQEKE